MLPRQQRALTPSAQAMFTSDIQVPVLATEELYGGKLVAALDRQHPRDLFDVQLMLKARDYFARQCVVALLDSLAHAEVPSLYFSYPFLRSSHAGQWPYP